MVDEHQHHYFVMSSAASVDVRRVHQRGIKRQGHLLYYIIYIYITMQPFDVQKEWNHVLYREVYAAFEYNIDMLL